MSRYPFPIPFGWFQMCWSHEIAAGAARPYFYFDRHLVVWRDEDGVAHTNDAFCPHLGAHLGHGGRVVGTDIECPFHGWKFDGEGNNTEVPYADRTNKLARIRPYPTIERNGMVMAWYHPADEPPAWDIPEVAPFNDPENYSQTFERHYEINCHWQEVAENVVDGAHFRYVHDTDEVPVLERYDYEEHHASMRSAQKFVTPQGVVDGRIDVENYGPGFSHTAFNGIVETHNLGCNTPISVDKCVLRFTLVAKKLGEFTTNVGEGFMAEIDKQVLEDKPVWENKAHLVRPALASTDGPFMKFRRWASQFYAEDVDTDQTVFVPDAPTFESIVAFTPRAKETSAAGLSDRY